MDEINKINFDYYYGKESEQFNFYIIPLLLLTSITEQKLIMICMDANERSYVMKANNKTDKNISREEYLYHNTEILLSKYRDVVWSIEVSAIQAQISFELEMDCKLEEFLEMSYSAGVDLTGTQIQEQIRTLERNKKMLKIIDAAIQVLREKEVDGDVIYWILYYTYLSKRPCKNIDEIIDRVSEKTEIISRRTYFKKRKKQLVC